MNKFCLVLVIVANCFILVSTQACSQAIDRFIAANMNFSRKIFFDISNDNNLTSFVICPFGMLFPMAPYIIYTNPGTSRTQLVNLYNISPSETKCVTQYFIKVFSEQQQNGLIQSLLYAIDFISSAFTITASYKNDTAAIMGYPAESLSFNNTTAAANTINARIRTVTNGRVPTIVSPSMLSTGESICKPHAVTFTGQLGFDPKLTTARPFYVSSTRTITRQMMYRKDTMLYAESPLVQAQVIRLNYVNTNLTFICFRPYTNDGYKVIINGLRNATVLPTVLSQLRPTLVELRLPKGFFNFTTDLRKYFQNQGVTDVFNAATANFANITTANNGRLFVSTFRHFLSYSIDETGPFKSAPTTPPTKIFNANCTYVFLITLLNDTKFFGVDAGF